MPFLLFAHRQEYGFDDSAVDEDLQLDDVEESQLIEFFEEDGEYTFPEISNYPYSDHPQKIYDALRRLWNGSANAMKQTPLQLDMILEIIKKITDEERKTITELYKNQCPTMNKDGTNAEEKALYTVLAAQRKCRVDLLQHLTTDFHRWSGV